MCKKCRAEYQRERLERLQPSHIRRPKGKPWNLATLESVSPSHLGRHARFVTRKRIQTCFGCGWKQHVDACHIKPVSSFPKETLLVLVNDSKNLLLLCPNCHWLFDHGPVLRIRKTVLVEDTTYQQSQV